LSPEENYWTNFFTVVLKARSVAELTRQTQVARIFRVRPNLPQRAVDGAISPSYSPHGNPKCMLAATQRISPLNEPEVQ
jgi:hypothetical protein